MTGTMRDLRTAVRALRRRPAFAVAGTLTLTITLGAATLLFSVAEGVVLRPLPYADPERVVTLYLLNEAWRESENELLRENWDVYNVTPRHVEAFRARPGPLADGGFTVPIFGTIEVGGLREPASGVRVDERVFPTLGVEPALGRLPTPDEYASGARVAVLRDDLWRQRFGADPDVLGSSLGFGDEVHTIIGVMPPGFYFPAEHTGSFWSPIPPAEADYRGFGVGRLAPGVTAGEASVALDGIARRLGEDDIALARFGARAVPALEDLTRHVRLDMLLLLGTGLVVLLAACTNLANLVLARGVRRRGEMAVRAAIGASRASLVRATLAEVALVTVAGALLGVTLAALATRPFVEALSAAVLVLPRSGDIGLNPMVIAFASAATLTAMLIAGLPGALGAWAGLPARGLAAAGARRGGRASSRARRALLGAQAALAAVVLTGAALLVASAGRAGSVDPGFDPDGLAWLAVTVARPGSADGAGAAGGRAAASPAEAEALQDALASLPGVHAAALASRPPIGGGLGLTELRRAEDPPGESRQVPFERVSPRFFATLGLPTVLGRVAQPRTGDLASVVLSESLARALSRGASPLGMRVIFDSGDEAVAAEVVAVVADARQFLLVEPVEQFYVVSDALPGRRFVALMRGTGEATETLARAREAVAASLPGATVEEQGTVRSGMRETLRPLRTQALLVGALAGLAVLLTVIGIVGLAAHFLGEQRREIAIRLTLGAEPGREVRRVVGHALVPTVTGLVLGLVAAATLSRAMADAVFGVSPTDPLTYGVVGAALAGIAGMAAWIPGRRATGIEPAQALDEI